MKKINEKWQAIILVTLVITFLSAGFSSFIIYSKNACVDKMMNIEQMNIRSIISTIEHTNTSRYIERIKSLVNYHVSQEKERMLLALKDKDRKELYRLSKPFYEALKKEDPNFLTFGWFQSENTVLLRMHKPELFDDDISVILPDIVQVNVDYKQNVGYEAGRLGLEFRVTQPVSYNDMHIGVVQFGLKDSFLLDLIEDSIGIPAAMVIPNKTADIIEFSKLPKFIDQDYTIQSYDPNLFSSKNIDWVLDKQIISVGNKKYSILKIVDLNDFSGETQGSVFVAIDISNQLADLWRSIKFIIILSIIFLIFSILFLFKSLNGLIQKNIDLNKALIEINSSLETEVEKLGQAAYYAGDVIFMTDIEGVFTFTNPAFTTTYGFEQNEVLGKKTPRILKSGLMKEEEYVFLWNSLLNGTAVKRELINKKKDGSFIEISCSTSPVFNDENNIIGFLDIQRDITERKINEKQIKSALSQKEALLRELYHRTQNNMQLISSLLSLKTASINDESVAGIFTDIDLKIQSMALVHQKLFDTQDLSNINLKEYVKELCELFIDGYALDPGKITLKFDLEDITALIDIAIPLGLVLSELASNSIKHAFSGGARGEISIKLRELDDDLVELVFKDNGSGAPDDFNFKTSKTLGLETICILAEGQLQGEVLFENDYGVSCTVRFKKDIYRVRV